MYGCRLTVLYLDCVQIVIENYYIALGLGRYRDVRCARREYHIGIVALMSVERGGLARRIVC